MEQPQRFQSKLDNDLYYDELFVSTDIDENDTEFETNLHLIKIFGNSHHIAMGKKNIHESNDKIIYFFVYLIHNEKVVTKLGLYEILVDDESTITTDTTDFQDMELLVHPKYYEMIHYLEEFKISDLVKEKGNEPSDQQGMNEEAEEEEEEKVSELSSEGENRAENVEENEVEMEKELEVKLIKSNDNIYEVIRNITKGGEEIRKKFNNDKTLLNHIADILGSYHKPNFVKGIRDDTLSQSITKKFKQVVKDLVRVDKDTKKKFTPLIQSINEFYINDEYKYSINEFILSVVEFLANVKFVQIDKDTKSVNSISLFKDVNNHKSFDPTQYTGKFDYLIKEFDPTVFILLCKMKSADGMSEVYDVYQYDGKTNIELNKSNVALLNQIDAVYRSEDHEYKFDTQMKSFKQFIAQNK